MSTIKLKNGSGAPAASDLVQGEPALDLTNKRLYTEDSGGNVIEVGTNPGVDVTFADNRKAIFGAGDDLQIFHDGSNSYVQDSGDGSLILNTTNGGGVYVYSAGETMATFNSNGPVNLYHDNAAKLATTSTGIDVTGTVVSDGLTVDGQGTFTTADNSAQVTLISTDTDALVGPQLNLWRNSGTGTNGDLIGQITFTGEDTVGSTNTFASIYSVADQTNNGAEDGSIHFQTLINGVLADRLEINSAGNTVVTGTVTADGLNLDGNIQGDTGQNMQVSAGAGTGDKLDLRAGDDVRIYVAGATAHKLAANFANNGDVSLYEDTGTTAKLFWDASAESLGIGTSSPSNPLHVATASTDVAKFATTGAYNFISLDNATRNWALSVGSTFQIYDATAASTRMSIDASGNLLVGKTSTAFATEGFVYEAGAAVEVTTDSNRVMRLNRTTSDGNIIELNKDGSTVGSIAINSSRFELDGSGNPVRMKAGTSNIQVNNNTHISFDNAGTESMRIDSSGNVGIGTSSPAEALHVNSGNTNDVALFESTDLNAKVSFKDSTSTSAINTNNGNMVLNCDLNNEVANSYMAFRVDNDEKMQINASGNVGIGTSSPDELLHLSHTGGNAVLKFTRDDTTTTAGSSVGTIQFAHTDADNAGVAATIVGKATNAFGKVALVFATGNPTTRTERMRLDAEGNLLVGKTGTGIGTVGVEAKADGQLWATRDGNPVLSLNRETSNGSIAVFYKDGTTAGSIGTNSSLPYFAGTSIGLKISGTQIRPSNSTGNNNDNAVDLGKSDTRFKDLYLSGGAYLGGTGSANLLDDYEEGTWTPALEASTTNPTPTAVTVNNATYTKVGRMVHIQAYITVNLTSTGSGGAQITGLPFTVGTGYAPVQFVHGNLILSSGGYFNSGSTKIIAVENNATSSIGYAGTGTKALMISGTYEVA